MPDRILWHRYAHRVVAHPRLQADDRGRHVAVNAPASGALRATTRVWSYAGCNRAVTCGTKGIVVCSEVRVGIHIAARRMGVAGRTRRSSRGKTLAL